MVEGQEVKEKERSTVAGHKREAKAPHEAYELRNVVVASKFASLDEQSSFDAVSSASSFGAFGFRPLVQTHVVQERGRLGFGLLIQPYLGT